jgi:hypothetical protein
MGARICAPPPLPAVRARAVESPWSLLALIPAQAAFGLSPGDPEPPGPRRACVAEYVVANVTRRAGLRDGRRESSSRAAPANGVGWLLLRGRVSASAWAAWTGQYARYALVDAARHPPGRRARGLAQPLGRDPAHCGVRRVLPLLFPNGRLPSARWRPLAWLGTVATALFTLSPHSQSAPVNASLPEVANPFAPAWSEEIRWGVDLLALLTALASLATGVAAAATRLRGARGSERRSSSGVAYATAPLSARSSPRRRSTRRVSSRTTLLSGILLPVGVSRSPRSERHRRPSGTACTTSTAHQSHPRLRHPHRRRRRRLQSSCRLSRHALPHRRQLGHLAGHHRPRCRPLPAAARVAAAADQPPTIRRARRATRSSLALVDDWRPRSIRPPRSRFW